MALEQTSEAHEAAVSGIEKFFGGGEDPKPEAQEGEPAQVEGQGTEQQATEGQEPAPAAQPQSEEVEVEIEGEKYLVPKKISDRFIQHADYTRKTQDVAEMRRALSAERETLNLNKAFEQTVEPERNRLSILDAQIAQFKTVDWAAIEDTGQLVKMREQLNQLKELRAELDTSIKSKRTEFDTKIKSHVQEALQAGEKYIAQHIKGFDESKKKELFDYGISEGYTQEEMQKIVDPRIVVSLWKARQWDALQASKPGIQNRAAQAAPTVRPGATVRQPSRVQQLGKAIKTAKTESGRKQAAVEYFTERFAK